MKINLDFNKIKRWPGIIVDTIIHVLERLVTLTAIILIGYILLGLIMLYIPGLPVLWRPPKKNPDMLLFAAAACLYVLRRK
jgi:hypothetical protein